MGLSHNKVAVCIDTRWRALRSAFCLHLGATLSKRGWPAATACRVAMWLIYSDTWNAIVDELRSKDLLSEKEKRNLNFQHLPIDDSVQVHCTTCQPPTAPCSLSESIASALVCTHHLTYRPALPHCML